MISARNGWVVALVCASVACSGAAVLAVDPPEIQPRMGQPVAGLTPEQLVRFELGKEAFNKGFTIGEGLGPTFNQTGCGQCHNDPDAGGSGNINVTRFGLEEKKGFDPLEYLGGSLLQKESIAPGCEEVVPDEATIEIQRVTNSAFGDGLVEAIPEEDLLANESDPPGISGRAHMVEALEDPGTPRVGRFGWKAQVPTMLSFSGDALLNEVGITNRLVPEENAPNGDLDKLAMCDAIPDPEDGPDEEGFDLIDRMADFQRFLAPPPQTPKYGMSGEQFFINIGCADCHIATPFITGSAPEAALSGKSIKPYSDFLLHSMGTLGDGIEQGDALGVEFRTPPLWGLRTRQSLIHDGRFADSIFAIRVNDAIEEHEQFASEANPSAIAYKALPQSDKDKIIAFLDSLGRAEFDQDGDEEIGLADYDVIHGCLTDPGAAAYTADDACAISDIDQDGDVDLIDISALQRAFTGD